MADELHISPNQKKKQNRILLRAGGDSPKGKVRISYNVSAYVKFEAVKFVRLGGLTAAKFGSPAGRSPEAKAGGATSHISRV
ncbi:hypothetical protein KJ652_02020, partial [Patescibacteria group bacterium]|nr:hypothetical protein [Patescibacteria group bacterium]MBU1123342.1 hypothetical protein [Patescibacteria group bacterium]